MNGKNSGVLVFKIFDGWVPRGFSFSTLYGITVTESLFLLRLLANHSLLIYYDYSGMRHFAVLIFPDSNGSLMEAEKLTLWARNLSQTLIQ